MSTESRDEATRACANLAAALRQCLPLLRGELQIIFESEAVWYHRDGTGIRAEFQPLDPEGAEHAAPIIASIRTAEALVGRVPDDCPDWLNDVIDGTREWRA